MRSRLDTVLLLELDLGEFVELSKVSPSSLVLPTLADAFALDCCSLQYSMTISPRCCSKRVQESPE